MNPALFRKQMLSMLGAAITQGLESTPTQPDTMEEWEWAEVSDKEFLIRTLQHDGSRRDFVIKISEMM